MKTETLTIRGMSCGHCVHAVRQALADMKDVDVQSVEIGSATVAYDPERTPRSTLVTAVEEEGYTVEPTA